MRASRWSVRSFVHDLPLWRNQLERTACQANPRHGSSSPLASLLEQIHPLRAAAAAHGNQSPAAPRILHCQQGLLICIWRVLMKLSRQHSYLLVLNLTNCIVKLCKTGIVAKVQNSTLAYPNMPLFVPFSVAYGQNDCMHSNLASFTLIKNKDPLSLLIKLQIILSNTWQQNVSKCSVQLYDQRIYTFDRHDFVHRYELNNVQIS